MELPEEKKMWEEKMEQETTKDESEYEFVPAQLATHEPDEVLAVKVSLE